MADRYLTLKGEKKEYESEVVSADGSVTEIKTTEDTVHLDGSIGATIDLESKYASIFSMLVFDVDDVTKRTMYTTTLEKLKELTTDGNLSSADQAALITKVLTELNNTVVSVGMQTAFAWAKEEKELELKQFEVVAQVNKINKEGLNSDVLRTKLMMETQAIQMAAIREHGGLDVDPETKIASTWDNVRALKAEGKAYQEAELLKAKVSTEAHVANKTEADTVLTKLGANKVAADVWYSTGIEELESSFEGDDASKFGHVVTVHKVDEATKGSSEVAESKANADNAVKQGAILEHKIYESKAAIHKIVADTATNFGTMRFKFADSDLVFGVDATESTWDKATLSDYQAVISREQAKGYAYNAWSNAITAASGVVGQGMAGQYEGFFKEGATGYNFMQIIQDITTSLSKVKLPASQEPEPDAIADYLGVPKGTVTSSVAREIAVPITKAVLTVGDTITIKAVKDTVKTYTLVAGDVSSSDPAATIASSINAKAYKVAYTVDGVSYQGSITATKADADSIVIRVVPVSDNHTNIVGIEYAKFNDVTGAAITTVPPKFITTGVNKPIVVKGITASAAAGFKTVIVKFDRPVAALSNVSSLQVKYGSTTVAVTSADVVQNVMTLTLASAIPATTKSAITLNYTSSAASRIVAKEGTGIVKDAVVNLVLDSTTTDYAKIYSGIITTVDDYTDNQLLFTVE